MFSSALSEILCCIFFPSFKYCGKHTSVNIIYQLSHIHVYCSVVSNTFIMLRTITTTQLCNAFHFVELKLYTHSPLTPHSTFPPVPCNQHPNFCFCDFDHSKYHTEVELYSICLFMTCLFHLVQRC